MFYDGHIQIEEEDQCYSCKYFAQGIMCPLLEALAVGVAHLDGDVQVKNCGFYVEFKRHLHLVDHSASPGNDTPPGSDGKEPPAKPAKRFNAP